MIPCLQTNVYLLGETGCDDSFYSFIGLCENYYQPPDESFSFPVEWHLDDPVKILSYNFIISFFLAAAVGTLQRWIF